jgi:cell migration-inducing and hyaluronan-binding protein
MADILFILLVTLGYSSSVILQATKSGVFSDELVWGGTTPTAGTSIVVPAGIHVTIDVSPPELSSVLVNEGTVTFSDKDLTLLSHRILLKNGGTLQAGSPMSPFNHNLNITLMGSRESANEIPLYGAKVLAIEGGTLKLYGQQRHSWMRLNATALQDQSFLDLEQSVRWEPGSKFVVTSTDFDAHQAEVRTITRVEKGTRVWFDEPLAFSHFGELQYFPGHGTNKAMLKVLDERAEVGLLTRNIIIQGDHTSAQEEYGCQVMMTGGLMHLNNVEVANCGQRSSLVGYFWSFGSN